MFSLVFASALLLAHRGGGAHRGQRSGHFRRPLGRAISGAQLLFCPNLRLPEKTVFSESGWLFDLTQSSAELGEGKAPRALLKPQQVLAASLPLEAFIQLRQSSLAGNSKGNPGGLANRTEL